MGWKLLVSGVLATMLSGVPVVALACTRVCTDGASSGAHAAHSSHAHHQHAEPDVADRQLESATHDCDDHDRIAATPTTVPRPVTLTSPSSASAAIIVQPLQIELGRSVHRLGSTHGPPGAPPAPSSLVLRI